MYTIRGRRGPYYTYENQGDYLLPHDLMDRGPLGRIGLFFGPEGFWGQLPFDALRELRELEAETVH